jgi:DNA polymerase-3 subunit beta
MTTPKTAPKTTTGTKQTGTRAKKASKSPDSTTVVPDIKVEVEVEVEAAAPAHCLITVQQSVLLKAIETVSSTIPMKKGHAGLLDRLRLTTDGETLKLTGFNLISGLEMSIPANVDGSGDWTVSAEKMQRLVQYFPSGAITLKWAPGEAMSLVSKTAGPFEINTRMADDCPTIPLPEAPQRFELADFRWGLKCVSVCAGEEDHRCIHLSFWQAPEASAEPKTAGITLTATKEEVIVGFYYSVPKGADLDLPDRTVSVAKESIQKLGELMIDRGCCVELDTVSTEDVVVRFVLTPTTQETGSAGVTVLTCRTDKVDPINGNSLSPDDPLPTEISVDCEQLSHALLRQAVITDRRAAVTLEIDNDTVVLTSAGADGLGTDTISAQVTGEPLTIKFDPHYLLECLQQVKSSQARLGFTGATTAAYVRDSERHDLFFVLAPAG